MGNDETIRVDDEENLVSVESKSGRIKTLEQLVNACEIDLDEWLIERHVINKWEVGTKLPDDLGGGIVVSPLFQVKAWMIRREPVAVQPVLQPVRVQAQLDGLFPLTNYGWKKCFYFADPHFGFSRDIQTGRLTPFHDRRALDVCLQIVQRGHFDAVVCGGDLADLAEWTDKFTRGPEFTLTTQPAVIEGSWWLGKFRSADENAKFYIIEGNHDLRMRSALITHLLAAYKLKPAHELHVETTLSIPYLFGLAEMGVEWVDGYPDARVWLSDYLSVEHGDVARKGPGATARAMLESGARSVAFGHIHRREMVSDMIDDRMGCHALTAACPGCTCRVDGVVPGHRRKQGWQQGALVIEYDGEGNQHWDMIPIWDGHGYYSGQLYKARDLAASLGQLEVKTGWSLG